MVHGHWYRYEASSSLYREMIRYFQGSPHQCDLNGSEVLSIAVHSTGDDSIDTFCFGEMVGLVRRIGDKVVSSDPEKMEPRKVIFNCREMIVAGTDGFQIRIPTRVLDNYSCFERVQK